MRSVVCLSESVTSQFILPILLEVRGMAEGSPNWRLAGTRPGGGRVRRAAAATKPGRVPPHAPATGWCR